MKILISWLKDYIDIDTTPENVAQMLSDAGFPAESIEYLENDDAVIDLEVTSNRGDCLSYIGVARELAAATGKKISTPELAKKTESSQTAEQLVEVEIKEPKLCPRYTARIIKDVKVGPTPDWMRKRLEALGARSVNNVVDATNYAMFETGQPPHAFDMDKLKGNKIIIRKAKKGESIVSIDSSKCGLDENMLVIADTEGPVAIAGVMGGLETEISDNSTNVLLEDAAFDPVCVRSTARKLALPSEAAFRFERFVDIEKIEWASQRTAELIVQVAGGKIIEGIVDAWPQKTETQTVGMRTTRLEKLLGIKIDKKEVMQIFDRLGFDPQEKQPDLIVCNVPSWRHDIYREADLIEEIARCHGYDKIPTQQKINIEVAQIDKKQKLSSDVRQALAACGFYETINVTFVDEKNAQTFVTGTKEFLRVSDQSRKSANVLRPELVGSLMNVIKLNRNAGQKNCRVYEIADTFLPNPEAEKKTLPKERLQLALGCEGDFTELRGAVEQAVKCADKHATVEFRPTELKWAQAAAEILINGQKTGTAGTVNKNVLKQFDIKDTTPSLAQIDFDHLLDIYNQDVTVQPIPKFPSITRDLSVIVDEPIQWEKIEKIVTERKTEILERIGFVGIYRGKQIPKGKKSVTISLTFRDDDGTLTHEKVDQLEGPIIEDLKAKLDAQLREN